MKDFNVTPHFTYHEMYRTSYPVVNVPFDALHIMNIRTLCERLEVIREKLGKPIIINSAFRTSRLNTLVGGVPNSDHLLGLAADIVVPGFTSNQLFVFLNKLSLDGVLQFGQVICYNKFVHVSFNTSKHKNDFFTVFL